jgi:prevent-host-death family protein
MRRVEGEVTGMRGILRLPTVIGSAEARRKLRTILDRVEKGEPFIITGPNRDGAMVVNLAAYRTLQDAYLDMASQLETMRLREAEGRTEDIKEASKETGAYTLSEVEKLIDEGEEKAAKEPYAEETYAEETVSHGLLSLPVNAQPEVMRVIRQIAEAPEEVGQPLKGFPNTRVFRGEDFVITWRPEYRDGTLIAMMLDIKRTKKEDGHSEAEEATATKSEDEVVLSRAAVDELRELPADLQNQVLRAL